MELFYKIVLAIIIIIVVKIVVDYNHTETFGNLTSPKIVSADNNYFSKFYHSNLTNNLFDNNKISNVNFSDSINLGKKNILIITFDNRQGEEYVKIHNKNIKKYVEKYGYEYKFYTKCNKNVYWCKVHMVLDALKTGQYDYVMWMDSDTIIKNFSIDIGNVINKYSSDIYIGSDNNDKYDITNSGVFIIKNSNIGKNFLIDCLNKVNKDCINEDGTLNGRWAASCYEQGIMNLMIADKYSSNTTVLTNDIIFNYNVCSDDVFIMHLYASASDYRVGCFNSSNPAIK